MAVVLGNLTRESESLSPAQTRIIISDDRRCSAAAAAAIRWSAGLIESRIARIAESCRIAAARRAIKSRIADCCCKDTIGVL